MAVEIKGSNGGVSASKTDWGKGSVSSKSMVKGAPKQVETLKVMAWNGNSYKKVKVC